MQFSPPPRFFFALCLTLAAAGALAQTLPEPKLAQALKSGETVIVMRHASSPRPQPDPAIANVDNPQRERQLDQTGRDTAIAMGKALRKSQIPIGAVLSSPTYRAQETIRLAQLPMPTTHAELGDEGHSMQPAGSAQTNWLVSKVQQLLAVKTPGGNTIIVTHYPNIVAAFPALSTDLADGEALVFASDTHGGVTLLARIKIEDWPHLLK